MPELPEVETLRRVLQPVLKNREILSIQIFHPKLVKESPYSVKRAVHAKITAVKRRAKIFLLELDNGYTLCVHLKMTGQLIHRNAEGVIRVGGHPIHNGLQNLPNTFTGAVFLLSDNTQLFFNDQRRFAYLHCRKTGQLATWFQSLGLGPEPNQQLRFQTFLERLHRHPKARIKDALLDQRVLAGLGNIYADEVNYAARVHPRRRVVSLNNQELLALYRAILRIIKLAVTKKGTTFHHFGKGKGMGGSMQKYLHAYGRDGQNCHQCGTILKREKIGGRSAHYCPKCQVLH
ncbi:MAG: bifunctional DNA-formamidopyrimidine glycosylase/DNA-(apurinic or apyrimidinic site) lyase [Candidatus Nomurabacteria bacterium]|nr:MAG: bifunctional DNA-formamidopyrimidine glycosylase/DNA-(apurinic or apyrimidinic site) lyase [Candidatus Nomurabacteria bacterium]